MAKKTISKIIVIFVALIIAALFALYMGSRPVDKDDENIIYVTVSEGAGPAAISDVLKEKDAIRSELCFRLVSKLKGNDSEFKAGAYAVSKSMSSGDISDMIAEGKTAGKVFTVKEGQTIDKVAKALEEQDICTEEEFFEEVQNGEFDYDFMKYLPSGATRLEGFLYPNTYSVDLDAGAHEAIDVMLKGFQDSVPDEVYEQAEEMNMNIFDIVTVASIVEKEASTEDDREKVASVIYNRLDKGMMLQMDSTINYIKNEENVISSYSDIAIDSSYNTYKNYGLPPGPICSPSLISIQAAADPKDTNYLYFVNDDKLDGTLAFAENETEHQKNKTAFEKAYSDYLKEHPEESE